MTAGEPLQGVVWPGPPPAGADRLEVVIRDEDGTPVQAVVRLENGSLVELTRASLETADTPPPPDQLFTPGPDEWAEAAVYARIQTRIAFGAGLSDPRSILRGITTP